MAPNPTGAVVTGKLLLIMSVWDRLTWLNRDLVSKLLCQLDCKIHEGKLASSDFAFETFPLKFVTLKLNLLKQQCYESVASSDMII